MRRLTPLIAAPLVVLVIVAIAIAHGGQPAQPSLPTTTPQASGVDPALAAHYAVFRRPATASDTPPSAEDVPERDAQFGLNPGLARLARAGEQGRGIYVVPGKGYVCLVGDDVGGACGPIGAMTQMPAIGTGQCGAFIPTGEVNVGALVPDGTSAVAIHLADGTIVPETVAGNVVFDQLPTDTADRLPTSISWNDSQGNKHSQSIDGVETTQQANCATG
jgi:hypothetical protein